jgi:hypothetical protein
MWIFSKILGAKQAADAHRKSSVVTIIPSPVDTQPYRHMPTHAKTDSMNLGAALSSPDLHERIKEENRRHSRIPLKRAGSDTYLEHRSSLAAKRSTRELAMLAAMQGDTMVNEKMKGPAIPLKSPQRPMYLHMAPTSNPYAMQPMHSPKRGTRSPAGSNSPVPSTRSAGSPLADSIAGKFSFHLIFAVPLTFVQKTQKKPYTLLQLACSEQFEMLIRLLPKAKGISPYSNKKRYSESGVAAEQPYC